MTRLNTELIAHIPYDMEKYDWQLSRITGYTLKQIALKAAQLKGIKLKKIKIGVIPITAGAGRIAGFTEAIWAIINYIGFNAQITKTTDVSGIREAILENCQLVFMADDDNFIAINLKKRKVIDNYFATAIAYVTALELTAGSLNGQRIGLIGLGKVGQAAAKLLLSRGARIKAFDPRVQDRLDLSIGLEITGDIDSALTDVDIIFDASPVPDFIDSCRVKENMIIAAPGIPLGITNNALKRSPRLIHDPLQLGVATMAMLAC